MEGPIQSEIEEAARTLWDYHIIYDDLTPGDAIIGLGSYDLRVAQRCADLWHEKLAGTVVLTGKSGNWTAGLYAATEAEAFAGFCLEAGVPEGAILIEPTATNIGENIRNSAALIGAWAIRVIIVTKPQTQRRVLATVKKQWPGIDAKVTAPMTPFADQPTANHSFESLVNEMTGDIQRLIDYPTKGFAIEQEIPPEVMAAYRFLVERGFDKHLS